MMTNPLNLDHRVLVDTARLLQKALYLSAEASYCVELSRFQAGHDMIVVSATLADR